MNVLLITERTPTHSSLGRMFEQLGCAVFSGRLSSFPLYILMEQSISLVVLEITDPSADLSSFCRSIRTMKEASSQILIVAAKEATGRVAECLAAGADHYFIQPVSNAELDNYLTVTRGLMKKKSLLVVDNKILGRELPLSATLFNYTNDLIHIIDREGRFIYVNSVWLDDLGYSDAELDTLTIFDIVRQEEQHIRADIEQWLDSEAGFHAFEYELRTKSGQAINVRGRAHPLEQASDTDCLFCACSNITGYKQLFESLQFSEERYRLICETARVGISMVDENEDLILVNPALASMLGYSQQELLGLNLAQLTDQNEFSRFREQTQYRKQGIRNEYETRMRRKDGEVRTFTVSVAPVTRVNGTYIGALGITTDITDIQNTVKELEKYKASLLQLVEERTFKLKKLNKSLLYEISERKKTEEELLRLKKAVETMQLGVTISDLERKIIFTNPAEARMHGYTVEELIGQDVGIFAPPTLHKKMPLKKITELTGFARETVNIRKDQSIFPVHLISDVVKDMSGKPVAIVTTCLDITEQVRAQNAIKESEEKFRSLTETAPLAIFIIQGHYFKYVNPAAAQLTGYTCDQLLSMRFSDIVSPDGIPDEALDHFDETSTGQKVMRHEMSIRDKTGTNLWIYLSLTHIEFEGESALLGSATDITDQKRVEAELRLFNERLEQKVAERTRELHEALKNEKELHEMKSQFISLVSHEFRTPLTSIASSAEIIQRYSQKLTEEKKNHYLERIRGNVQEMTCLLDDVTLIGKTDSGKLTCQPVLTKVDSFFRELIEELQLNTGHKCQIHFCNSCRQDELLVDPKLLYHIMINLINNAIKFSPENSLIEINTWSNENSISIEIQDHGCGIPEEDKANIFEAFCRGRNVDTVEGTGLGLTIVKRCVEAHNGSIEFSSQLDQGTTFTILLSHEQS